MNLTFDAGMPVPSTRPTVNIQDSGGCCYVFNINLVLPASKFEFEIQRFVFNKLETRFRGSFSEKNLKIFRSFRLLHQFYCKEKA